MGGVVTSASNVDVDTASVKPTTFVSMQWTGQDKPRSKKPHWHMAAPLIVLAVLMIVAGVWYRQRRKKQQEAGGASAGEDGTKAADGDTAREPQKVVASSGK